ncbi:MAG: N-acetylmuramoyl-L-alanine amidase [Eubacterium sp.]|nr:N-acetylmuramoyl-L-alanine amidase [Eubacterium sp.]
MKKLLIAISFAVCVSLILSACSLLNKQEETTATKPPVSESQTEKTTVTTQDDSQGKTLPLADGSQDDTTTQPKKEKYTKPSLPDTLETQTIKWDKSLEYASFSKIHTDSPKLYRAKKSRKNIVICVNAGHGTKGGESVKTQCHPDGTPKVTGGSTSKGALKASAVASGMTFKSGMSEAKANLSLALIVKDMLLDKGYDVLMIREDSDVQLDNIARTVLANNYSDAHISLHYDSTGSDKGLFYLGVPNVKSYRNMEPVKSHWREHEALGKAIVKGARNNSVKIYSDGNLPTDLTQTSYSTVPSIDVEVGDRASDTDEETQTKIARGIVEGIEIYFSN